MTDMSAENFIPWEQIEPLVREGMTGRQLSEVLLSRLGLPIARYAVLTVRVTHDIPTSEAIRHGLLIVSRAEATRLGASQHGSEVVA